MTKISTAVAGIDTAKHKLDVAVHGQAAHWQFENALRGWKRLCSELIKAICGEPRTMRSTGF